MMSNDNDNFARHIISDRAHLGEYVYAEKYRGYDGAYIFDLEKEYSIWKSQSGKADNKQ